MANKVTVVQNSREVSNMADKELNLSEEEQALLREFRGEREHLAREIQVRFSPTNFTIQYNVLSYTLSVIYTMDIMYSVLLQELRIQIADIDNELSALEEVKNELS